MESKKKFNKWIGIKGLTAFLALLLVAMSAGYGVGRGMRSDKNRNASKFENNAYAASVEIKTEATNIFVQVAKKVIPSVVNIFTTSVVRSPWGGGGGQDEMWRRFFEDFFGGEQFGGEGPGRQAPKGALPKSQSLGSGFIIETLNTGALILTNNHVIDGADEIKVKFTEELDEKESTAEVIGKDADLDIALLKVKTRRKLQALSLSDSEKLEVGEWIAAAGNPFGHGHSVTHGIVSAKERTLPGSFAKYLQVDAPINPGNSGGPLVNLAGEVVGINNAIDARGPGIGFAIPITLVKNVLPQLKEKGRVDRGYIGISVDDLRPDLAKSLKLDESIKAPIITNVMPGQPASKAGLQAYDVITEVNGKPVRTSLELIAQITAVAIGDKAKVKILRSGKEKIFEVDVVKRPDFKDEKSKRIEKPKGNKMVQPKVETGMLLETIDSEIAQELGLNANYKGVVVSQVVPGGAAFAAGLVRGDVVLEVDKKSIKTIEDFYGVVKMKKRYLLRVRRQDESGREIFAVVSLNLDQQEE